MKHKPTIDPVLLEIIRSRLEYGAEHMSRALWRSASSTIIREVLDYSTALFDAHGEMVAQSTQLPFQMMTMSAPLRKLVREGYPWHPGDVVLVNDPHLSEAQHLPDVMTFRPLFKGRKRVGFAGAVAHMLDVGGGAAGSYVATATEIYQEGLRIPAVKIIARGKPNQEIISLIRANVREEDIVLADITAMTACTAIGEETVLALCERYGAALIGKACTEILDRSEAMLRHRLRVLPARSLRAVDHVDDDGVDSGPIRLELKLFRRGRQVVMDFTGTSPQVKGPVNTTLSMTDSTVNYVLMAAFGEGIPKNDGCRRVVDIVAPRGSILNAVSPAPVASRVTVCHRVVDLILQAISRAYPKKVMAGYYGVSSICNLGGRDLATGKPWVHFDIEVGGWGARPESDGLDGFSAHIHNVANTPIEIVEQGRPLRVERYEFIPDSGGRGRHRGGLGLRRDIRLLQGDVALNLLGDHCVFPPQGLRGGEDGRTGGYVLNPETPGERKLLNKLANYPLKKGDVVSTRTPGGGGFGSPRLRSRELREKDLREGKTTR